MEQNNNGYHSNTGGRQSRRTQAARPKERKPNGKKRLWIVILAAAAAAVCIILAAVLPMSQPAPQPVHVTTETASVSTPAPSAAPTEKHKEHPTIRYSTLYEEEEYEIAAVFLSKIYKKSETDVFKFYQFYDAQTEAEFDEFVRSVKELELYETGVTPEYGDELITLTTCEYSQENGRMVVVARKVEKEAKAAETPAG